MTLVTGSGGPKVSPSREQLTSTLGRYGWAKGDFVVLQTAREEFVLIAEGVPDYRHDGRHFRLPSKPAELGVTERVFRDFLEGRDHWRRELPWEDVTDRRDAERPRGVAMRLTVLCALLIIAVVIFMWTQFAR